MQLIISLGELVNLIILKKLIIVMRIKPWFMNIFAMMGVQGHGVFVKLIAKMAHAYRKVFILLL